MSPNAKSQVLLYVSDVDTFDVYVYSFPSLAPEGKLTGFYEPQGECSDNAGNVWITNSLAQELLEYAHGGTTPIATIIDPLGPPVGCAVDGASGNLAVTNLYGSSGSSAVLVYKHATGTPTTYGNPKVAHYYFAGYDRNGNLYVSGATSTGSYRLVVLPRGSTALSLVSIKGGKIYFPGTVAWVGSTLVLGDQRCHKSESSCLYRASLSRRTARITGTTSLEEACDVAEAWVGTKQIAGGDYEYCSKRRSSADVWRYPAGGMPTAREPNLRMPVGATVSAK
jgi:hypothetical protein